MYSALRTRLFCSLRQSGWKKKYANSEWFDVLKRDGRIISTAPRDICHRGPHLLHAVVHLHLIDGQGRIYLQKRNRNKMIQPGKWDSSVGGHIDSGESKEGALFRETLEELSVSGFTPYTIGSYLWECPQEVELVHSHWTLWEGEEPRFDPVEIEDGRWWQAEEIEASLEKDLFTPNFCYEWEYFLRNRVRP